MIAQSFRYWLADLICAGALKRADNSVMGIFRQFSLADAQAREASARAYALQADLNARADALQADNAMWFEASAQLGAKFLLAGEAHEDEVDRLTAALRTIASMPTPSANATVRRMARVAQEVIK